MMKINRIPVIPVPYAAALPPPLCFTVPARLPATRSTPTGGIQTGGMVPLTPSYPKLMMDPSDPSTWQRPYRFT